MWLDGSTSHTRPPADVAADASQYGLLGAALNADFDWGTILLSGRLGQAVAGTEGRWLQGNAAVVTGGTVGLLGLRATLSGFGLRYLDPFSYDAAGVELRPAASYPVGPWVLAARARVADGGWVSNGIEGTLRIRGAELAAQRTFGALHTELAFGAADVSNGAIAGTFLTAAGDAALDLGQWVFGADIELQRAPGETQLGGGLRGSYTALPGVQVEVSGGRRVQDQLFGTTGSWSFSAGLRLRALRWSAPAPPPVVAVAEPRDSGRVVRFAIRAPGAQTVELAGDFSGWERIAMEVGSDGWWRLTRVLTEGLHHFGFLVDGDWVIPPEAPGVVDDGWGRANASVVVDL